MLLDGHIWRVDNDLCQALDDPDAPLRLLEHFYRRIVVNGLRLKAPDAALLLERSLDEKTSPYQVSLRLGRELMEVPSHIEQLKGQERLWLTQVKKKAYTMRCGEWLEFGYQSPGLLIRAYHAGETTNVRFAMADHTAWFGWQTTIKLSRDGRRYTIVGDFDRDIADYSNWHGDPHDYDGDGVMECPEGACYKIAAFDLASLPGFLLPPGESNTLITIPDDWMARLVLGGEASYPGFGIYFNTRQRFRFVVKNGEWSNVNVRYRLFRWGDRFRESWHEIDPGYAPP